MPQYFPLAISYSQGGLVNDQAAFNLTEDSFQMLENAFNFRGRVRRRAGYSYLSNTSQSTRLRRDLTAQALGNTDGAGNFSGNIITILGLEATAEIAPFSITVNVGAQVFTEPAVPDGTLNNGGLGTGTINYTTGALTINTDPNLLATPVTIDFSYYPTLPVMGIWPYETSSVNNEQTVCFDTVYSYRFNTVTTQFQQLGTATWTGGNSNFFYATNVLVPGTTNFLLFATNFTTGDPIRYFDGTNWITPFNPNLDFPATTFLQQARILVQYRGRLVALNTYEGATLGGSTNFPQRARWSQIGDPTIITGATGAWRSDIAGRGGFIDCPVAEQIVTAEFVRDTLIVGFERSTWKLRYTGNELVPFVWERINRELGAESTFSTIPFDKGVLSVGDKSINVCNGNSVEPIDQNIPDEVFKIHNGNQGVFRVHGIRDYYNRYVYWTFPDADTNPTFPNRVLAYDYENGAWAIFTDSFTTFGPWQSASDIRWADLNNVTWEEYQKIWASGSLQSQFPDIAAGNQQGYVFKFQPRSNPVRNVPSLQITALTPVVVGLSTIFQLTVPNHNMEEGEFVRVSGVIGNGSALNGGTYQIDVIDSNTINLLNTTGTAGTYLGLGEIERVFNMKVQSKKFNLMKEGRRGYFGYLDFLVDATANGEVTCEIRVDNEESTPINVPGTATFYNQTFTTQPNAQFYQDGEQIWQRFYCPTSAQFFDFTLTFSNDQMLTQSIIDEPVIIQAIIVWASKDGRLVK